MTRSSLLAEIKTNTEQNIQFICSNLKTLSSEQAAWKPAIDQWSVNEICWHLNAYATFYHQAFEKKITQTKFKNTTENYNSSPLGKAAYTSMKLGKQKNIKRKLRAQKSMDPSAQIKSDLGNEIQKLEKAQIQLLGIIQKAHEVSLRKVKIPITVSKLVRFRLGDALLFVTFHNDRHLQQALNVINNANFPKS